MGFIKFVLLVCTLVMGGYFLYVSNVVPPDAYIIPVGAYGETIMQVLGIVAISMGITGYFSEDK